MRRHRRKPRAGTRIAVGVVASVYFAVSAVLLVQSRLDPDKAITGALVATAFAALGVGTVRLRRWAFRTTVFLCVVSLLYAVPAFFSPFAFELGDPQPVGRQIGAFALASMVPITILAIAALVDDQLR